MAQYGSMTLRERQDRDVCSRCGMLCSEGLNQSVNKKWILVDNLKPKARKAEFADATGREVKRSRKLNSLPKKYDRTSRSKYDAKGIEKDTGLDLCDCLIEGCPGCWMDCPTCGSRKCGHECRVYRRYKYDYVEIEGTNMTIKHPSSK